MYRKYYSYNDMPHPIAPPQQKPQVKSAEKLHRTVTEADNKKGLSVSLESDDIILIAVLVILFMNECDDKLLLGAIAFLLFANG